MKHHSAAFLFYPIWHWGKMILFILILPLFSFCLFFQVEHGKYAEGLRWIRDVLFYVDFEPARVKDIAKELAGRVSLTKRFGCRVCTSLLTEMNSVEGNNMIFQHFRFGKCVL